MSFRGKKPLAAGRVLSLDRATQGVPYRVALLARPRYLSDRVWQGTVLRLEELGLFAGERVEKKGSFGPFGAVIVRAGGNRVAISRDLARSVLVKSI